MDILRDPRIMTASGGRQLFVFSSLDTRNVSHADEIHCGCVTRSLGAAMAWFGQFSPEDYAIPRNISALLHANDRGVDCEDICRL